ncbi:hypothetical protein PISMIDRAFT_535978 [Pisolithus microcarpus 441]|uniref:Unplaced genomic scaffold scaffold_63, whole genome shotgun sequence n=1 Tax=Pisolithus microcarpus 441 TaxID=765257 RepID=A0A0C9YYC4_9AGAM|nr:hypothetical protein PISMIDRAFT_535978 [Pisolithus microcarpus 441]
MLRSIADVLTSVRQLTNWLFKRRVNHAPSSRTPYFLPSVSMFPWQARQCAEHHVLSTLRDPLHVPNFFRRTYTCALHVRSHRPFTSHTASSMHRPPSKISYVPRPTYVSSPSSWQMTLFWLAADLLLWSRLALVAGIGEVKRSCGTRKAGLVSDRAQGSPLRCQRYHRL